MQDDARPLRDRHLTRHGLRRFLEKRQSIEEENELLLHHLTVCAECAAASGPLVDLFEAGDLGGLGFCSVEVDMATSRAEASRLWQRLQKFPGERRKGLVRDVRRFHSWGLCELLCRESVRLAAVDTAQAVETAELAVAVSAVVEEDQPAELLWIVQLRAFAWAHLGNARRVQGELRSAEDAFARSEALWEEAASMGNILDYEARLLDLKASLRRDQRRLPEAMELLDRALLVDEEEGGALKTRFLINKSKTLEELGSVEQAIALLHQAEPLVDSERDPRLLLCLRHNLVDYLSKAGRFEEAAGLLATVQALNGAQGDDLDAVRLRWTEGRIAAGLGQAQRAILLLEDVRKSFCTRDIGYDAALASLELAALYAREGRAPEVKALSREMLPIFQAQDIHREALAALAFFLQAAEQEAVTADLADRLAEFVRRARYTPDLRFEEKR